MLLQHIKAVHLKNLRATQAREIALPQIAGYFRRRGVEGCDEDILRIVRERVRVCAEVFCCSWHGWHAEF